MKTRHEHATANSLTITRDDATEFRAVDRATNCGFFVQWVGTCFRAQRFDVGSEQRGTGTVGYGDTMDQATADLFNY